MKIIKSAVLVGVVSAALISFGLYFVYTSNNVTDKVEGRKGASTLSQPMSELGSASLGKKAEIETPTEPVEKALKSRSEPKKEDTTAEPIKEHTYEHLSPEMVEMLTKSWSRHLKRQDDDIKREEKLNKDRFRREKTLELWYLRLFNRVPENPINSLKGADNASLEKVTGSGARKIGGLIGRLKPVSDWLSWFENLEEYGGVAGMTAIGLLNGILISTNIHKSGLSESESKRVLAVLESFITAWQGQYISVGAQTNFSRSLQRISPVAGGLEFIRHWTVENPYGHEALESNLVETLHYWPINESGVIAVEALSLARAGAIKGVTDSWLAAQRRYHGCVWTAKDVKNILTLPLGQAVKEAMKMSGILYAELFAGDDLLAPQVMEIGEALLARRDSVGASSYGFIFIRRDDVALSDSLWTEWFNSSDEYKIKSACTATNLGMGSICRTTAVLDRMYSLAVDTENSKGIRSAAAWPLSILDKKGRALELLESWLAEGESQPDILIAIGRIVIRASETEVVALLKHAIDDDAATAEQRHYPLFLLATVAPDVALTYCKKDLPFPSKFEALSIMLCAATAQAQLTTANDNSDPRVEAIYRQIPESEPDWVRAIRLGLDYVEGHTSEQRVASYPASRP